MCVCVNPHGLRPL